MTVVINKLDQLQEIRSNLHLNYPSKKIALVPTMGALHEGHLSLVKHAQELADIVFVSIFVNPLQFGEGEDFDSYPRTFEEDKQKLEALNVDCIFAPDRTEVYPDESSVEIIKANEEISNRLCGLSRPGHFDGVTTVVKKLFDLVKPGLAIFGEKDYQQLLVIKSMVEEYGLDLEVLGHPIVREEDGLAMSSRNKYLSAEDRAKAPEIYKELNIIRSKLLSGEAEFKEAVAIASQNLKSQGIQLEYLEIYKERIFLAAKLAATRLIDNLAL